MITNIIKNNMHDDTIKKLVEAGYSFFNIQSQTKRVFAKWKHFQKRKPTFDEIKEFTTMRYQNYAIVCGEISDLVVVDVDTKNGGDPTPFQNRGFYEVATPSGGYHFYFKYEEALKNTWHSSPKTKGLLKGYDIQSNDALVFCPPSHFRGMSEYKLVNDAPIDHMPADLLLQILEEVKPEKEVKEYTPFTPVKIPEMGRPGDIFNAIASWEDVLYPLGWKKFGSPHGDIQYWTRPGKRSGVSASTNYKGSDLLFPFTNQTDLDDQKGYTKFNAYTTLVHDGDYKKAAKALVIENYKIANLLI